MREQNQKVGSKRGFVAKATAAVFPRVPKRGNPTMTTSTVRARRKGDPHH